MNSKKSGDAKLNHSPMFFYWPESGAEDFKIGVENMNFFRRSIFLFALSKVLIGTVNAQEVNIQSFREYPRFHEYVARTDLQFEYCQGTHEVDAKNFMAIQYLWRERLLSREGLTDAIAYEIFVNEIKPGTKLLEIIDFCGLNFVFLKASLKNAAPFNFRKTKQ